MNCAYHPEADAVGACVNCGRLICVECKTVMGGKFYCNPCADKMLSVKPGVGVSQSDIGALAVENTSGQGKLAVVPREIQGWNWGAFLLNWIWAIGNSVWIGLLALIPYAGFIMAIVLGVKGSEWAWQKKRWNSIQHFKRTQRTWAKWGIGVTVGSLVLGILIAIIYAILEGQY